MSKLAEVCTGGGDGSLASGKMAGWRDTRFRRRKRHAGKGLCAAECPAKLAGHSPILAGHSGAINMVAIVRDADPAAAQDAATTPGSAGACRAAMRTGFLIC